ncbi:MAG: hypothetical protein ABJF11_09385 [Reichenbachiella sp.]|uniref:hypothetical protein n=1 Tax=Reichenbachiella sp. TaxID=2184521 RepID=UPI003265A15F
MKKTILTLSFFVSAAVLFAQSDHIDLNESKITGNTLNDGTGYLDLEPNSSSGPVVRIMKLDRFGLNNGADGHPDLLFQLLPDQSLQNNWSMLESYGGAGLYIGTGQFTSPIAFGINRIEKMRLSNQGYLGIGTSLPNHMIHVKGNPAQDAAFSNRQLLAYFEQSANTSNTAGIAIKGAKKNSTSTVSYLDFDIYDNDESTTDFTLSRVGGGKENGTGINGQLRFFTNDGTALIEQMRIKANGDIGIGTSSPDAKLTVKGEIHAERVKVDLNIPAPDYVFEEDYQLLSLKSTAEYIDANNHLPEVPSAEQLAANGIDVVDMNMLLLKKIEELTLHLIEKEKDIELLKNENKNLRLLEERVNKIEKTLNP